MNARLKAAWSSKRLRIVLALLLLGGLWRLNVWVPYLFPWDVRLALTDDSPMELLSLEPSGAGGGLTWATGSLPLEENFHNRKILGTVRLDNEEKHELVRCMWAGIGSHIVPIEARCFNPRHGLRVNHGGQIYDVLICFECLQVYVVQPGDTRDHLAKILIDRWPQAQFDALLTRHHVPLASKHS